MSSKTETNIKMPPYTFQVEKVKIKEFVEAIGDKNPIFIDREVARAHGYPDTPCPPTFITLAFQEFTEAYFKAFEKIGVSLQHVLHGEEEYEYLNEIYPGDRLTCSMEIEPVIEKKTRSGKLGLITMRTCFKNQKKEEVLRTRSLIIERK